MKKAPFNGIEIKVDAAVYPLEVIKAACYGFTDRAHIRITKSSGGQTSIEATPKQSLTDPQKQELSGEFHNELIHQSLRIQISRANQKIREYIVTKALVSAQQPSSPPAEQAQAAACPECAVPAQEPAPAAVMDKELEVEIDKLLAEIEKGEKGEDPLGVSVPWEEKYGEKPPKKDAPPSPDKA